MKDVSMKELENKATEMRMKVVDMIYKSSVRTSGRITVSSRFYDSMLLLSI